MQLIARIVHSIIIFLLPRIVVSLFHQPMKSSSYGNNASFPIFYRLASKM